MNKKSKYIKKDTLISQIAENAKISSAKATIAYETVLLESPSFRKQSVKTVKTNTQKVVRVPGKTEIKEINLKREKAVRKGDSIEKIKIVEVKVPVAVEKIKEVIKEVEVVKEVAVVVEKTVIKEVEVVKEVPVEVIKEVTLVREVEKEVVKEVKVKDEKEINNLKSKISALQKSLKVAESDNKALAKKLAAKPKTIIEIREVIKEVPVEIIREVEIVKQIDFASLQKMMQGMKTVEISKTVVGETRTKKEGKIVERREVKSGTNKNVSASQKQDDLTKIEGIGPKISGLLSKGGISSFKMLSTSQVSRLQKILDAAGPRYQMHNPGSWPRQAALAAAGQWKKLAVLQEELLGGK